MATRIIDLNKFLLEEIRNKYEFFEKGNFETTANMSVDSFFPKLFYKKMDAQRVPVYASTFNTSSFAISEFIANTLEVRKAHVSELCALLGYTHDDIKRMLLDTKRKKLDLFLIGFGGTGTNFNYWMKELNTWTHTVNVFNTIYVNDSDVFTLSNIIRIPFDFRTRTTVSDKKDNFDNSSNIASKIVTLTGTDTAKQHALHMSDDGTIVNKDVIYYGAPDIGTRQDLSEAEHVRFISATHSGDEAQLYLNPPQDDTMQIETYGKINLSVFFMNHLKMTIEFIRFLSNSDSVAWNMSGEIMEYNFKNEYNNESLAATPILYRFPCLTIEEQEQLNQLNNAEFQNEGQEAEPTEEVAEVDYSEGNDQSAETITEEILQSINEEARI